MSEYTFTLTFALGSADADSDELIERLGAAGCDDALVGLGRRGRLALEFTRQAPYAGDAVSSAIADVRRAVPAAALMEAWPDLVGLTDVATLLNVTRQNVRKLILAHEAPPPPVHEGRPALWRLAKVLRWLREEKHYSVPDDLLELAEVLLQVNIAVEARDADSTQQRRLASLLS